MTSPAPIRSDWLDAAGDVVAHGFFTRNGGVSTGEYASLNVGFGTSDDPANISENRNRVARSLGVREGPLATPLQTHSADTVFATGGWLASERPKADAVVTDRPGVVLGVLTADCGPVLFADPRAGVVAAAHAGWRGAIGGILESAVAAMEKLGARRADLRAVLGPTIRQQSYEVGPELVDRLESLDPDNRRYLMPSKTAGHALFDLPAYILARLARIGVAAQSTGQCTYANAGDFYSYRRMMHTGKSDYGRQISAIVLEG